jgi:hypothetical protein
MGGQMIFTDEQTLVEMQIKEQKRRQKERNELHLAQIEEQRKLFRSDMKELEESHQIKMDM